MIYNPQLEGDPFFWQAGPVGVLLVHGFTATTAEVRPLAEALHRVGYTISAPLLPGHFTNPNDLNNVRWQDWVSHVEKGYQNLAEICEIVIVGGESTGGLLCLELASRNPEIAALLLYAPALKLIMNPFKKIQLRLLAPFLPWIPKKNFDDRSKLWQGYTVNPLKGVLQLLELQDFVMPLLPNIRQPMLIMQGKQDPTVDPKVPELICKRVNSEIKEIHILENSAHCVVIDREFEQVIHKTIQFLDRTLSKNTIQLPIQNSS